MASSKAGRAAGPQLKLPPAAASTGSMPVIEHGKEGITDLLWRGGPQGTAEDNGMQYSQCPLKRAYA